MNERIVGKSFDSIGTLDTGKSESERVSRMCKLQCGSNFVVSFRRSKPHHNIFGMKNRFQPGPELNRNIQRRQRTFANDHGMNELDRNMLGISGVGTASECKHTPSRRK